ncbi:hypothetical protein GMB65_16660 [Turicibacter sanguinis]|nr:hypothetical protein [Turicibacter sanguinis]
MSMREGIPGAHGWETTPDIRDGWETTPDIREYGWETTLHIYNITNIDNILNDLNIYPRVKIMSHFEGRFCDIN